MALNDAPLHVRLLNLLSAIRGLAPYNTMTPDEDELLRDLIVRWHAAEEISVMDVMRSLASVSQTTAYRRLIALRDKGMIELSVDSNDRRTKFVKPTALTKDYAARINLALSQLLTDANPA